jgi:ribose-phosphate pyrophosphokinase
MSFNDMMVFTGNANPKLAASVVEHLGMRLGKAQVSQFSDGEVNVEILENVRGRDVFILQSTCAPTNDNLMELVILRLCPTRSPPSLCARGNFSQGSG